LGVQSGTFKAFMKEESLERSASIRKLLAEGLQHWKEQRALENFQEGKVTFLKAAESSRNGRMLCVGFCRYCTGKRYHLDQV